MNKRELEQHVKKCFSDEVTFRLELYKKQVYFSLFGYDNKEICYIEIPYENRFDKEKIYIAIASLINSFDFSFTVSFNKVKDIYKFLLIGGKSAI